MKRGILNLLLLVLFSSTSVVAQSYPGASLTLIASDVGNPVQLTHAGDGSGRRYVVDLNGKIFVIEQDGSVSDAPLIDLTGRVVREAESGLLSVAFHPGYSENGRFFVAFVERTGDDLALVLEEFVAEGGTVGGNGRTVLSIPKPSVFHNGGQLAFGPEGYLYLSTGDGGGGGEDPFRTAQNPDSLLGKILRIDVDRDDPYAIPPDNPFVGREGYRPEIWALGLRNPWRFSFDRESGRLFVGDVGARTWEEVDLVKRGRNYGWSEVEGFHCFRSGCDREEYEPPLIDYSREEGDRSISGGFVYRGKQETSLYGRYIFGDFVTGRIWWLEEEPQGRWSRHELMRAPFLVPAFGEDEDGELYVMELVGGRVYRLDFHSRMIFPHFVDGPSGEGKVRTELVLTNPHPEPVKGILTWTAFDGEGSPVVIDEAAGPSFEFELPAHSSRRWVTSGDQQELLRGWLEVASEVELVGSVYLSQSGADKSWEIPLFSSRPGTRVFAVGEVDSASSLNTALAVANTSSSETTAVTVEAYAGDELVDSYEVTLAPLSQGAAFLTEILELPSAWSGAVVIRATHNVAVTAMRTRDGRPERVLDLGGG